MTNLSLKEKHKFRVGPIDYKRNSRAKRSGDRAISFVFASMLVSVAFIISYL